MGGESNFEEATVRYKIGHGEGRTGAPERASRAEAEDMVKSHAGAGRHLGGESVEAPEYEGETEPLGAPVHLHRLLPHTLREEISAKDGST